MRTLICWIALLSAALVVLLAPRRAAACSCLGTPIHHSDPKDGASDVALNQALFVEGVFKPSTVRLEEEGGKPVAFELNAGPWPGCPGTSADVLPKLPLAPNTRYVLRVEPLYPAAVSPGESASIHFTTGAAMLPDEALDAPRGAASVLFDAPQAMCGDSNTVYVCLGLADADDVELIMRRGREVLLRTTTLVQDDAAYAIKQMPDCVELRRRSKTGKRSEPTTICDDALHARRWVTADSMRQVVQCRDGVIGTQEPVDTAGASPPVPMSDAGSGTAVAGMHVESGSGAETDAHAHAGERSSAPIRPQPSAANEPEHRSYGCAATTRTAAPVKTSAFGLLLLIFGVATRARVARRRRCRRIHEPV